MQIRRRRGVAVLAGLAGLIFCPAAATKRIVDLTAPLHLSGSITSRRFALLERFYTTFLPRKDGSMVQGTPVYDSTHPWMVTSLIRVNDTWRVVNREVAMEESPKCFAISSGPRVNGTSRWRVVVEGEWQKEELSLEVGNPGEVSLHRVWARRARLRAAASRRVVLGLPERVGYQLPARMAHVSRYLGVFTLREGLLQHDRHMYDHESGKYCLHYRRNTWLISTSDMCGQDDVGREHAFAHCISARFAHDGGHFSS